MGVGMGRGWGGDEDGGGLPILICLGGNPSSKLHLERENSNPILMMQDRK